MNDLVKVSFLWRLQCTEPSYSYPERSVFFVTLRKTHRHGNVEKSPCPAAMYKPSAPPNSFQTASQRSIILRSTMRSNILESPVQICSLLALLGREVVTIHFNSSTVYITSFRYRRKCKEVKHI